MAELEPAPPAPDREPWEKQKGETAKAFAAFALHRDQGPTRTMVKTAVAYGEAIGPRGGKEGSVQVAQIEKWSRQYGWRDRCEAYDLMVDRRHREAELTLRERILEQHRFAGQLGVQAAIQRAQGTPEVEKLSPARMDWGEWARVLSESVRVQRLAMGEPTDFVKGALSLTPPQVQEIVKDTIEICLRYMPEERQPAAIRELQAYFDRGEGGAPALAAAS